MLAMIRSHGSLHYFEEGGISLFVVGFISSYFFFSSPCPVCMYVWSL